MGYHIFLVYSLIADLVNEVSSFVIIRKKLICIFDLTDHYRIYAQSSNFWYWTYTPQQSISNEELVESFNKYVDELMLKIKLK